MEEASERESYRNWRRLEAARCEKQGGVQGAISVFGQGCGGVREVAWRGTGLPP